MHATGITLSERQAEEARVRIAAAEMEANAEIRVCDYRDLTGEANRYNAIDVFPNGDIPPLPMMLRAAESAGFEIRDVENLREHYRLTLRRSFRVALQCKDATNEDRSSAIGIGPRQRQSSHADLDQ